MNPNLNRLHPYPFERLLKLKQGIQAPQEKKHIALSIGEPKHAPPQFVIEAIKNNIERVANYPTTIGLPELRDAAAHWLSTRFKLTPNTLTGSENTLPVNGTREALFAFVQCVIDTNKDTPTVLMPNPFYQIYEGATLMAGATPHFLNCLEENNYIPDISQIDENTWKKCQLVFICTPGNPTGAVMSTEEMKELIALADKYDFIIASDECYSELYFNEDSPPPGLLQACAELGRDTYERCIVFHSLSKRSNLPGLRSGFVAGDKAIIANFLKYRTYHGCSMPISTQLASIAAWEDEEHVRLNREMYRKKFKAVIEILDGALELTHPDASFYLWPKTPVNEADFCKQLYQQQNITALPGSFLARDTQQGNPGSQRVRIALVAALEECIDAAERIKTFCKTF